MQGSLTSKWPGAAPEGAMVSLYLVAPSLHCPTYMDTSPQDLTLSSLTVCFPGTVGCTISQGWMREGNFLGRSQKSQAIAVAGVIGGTAAGWIGGTAVGSKSYKLTPCRPHAIWGLLVGKLWPMIRALARQSRVGFLKKITIFPGNDIINICNREQSVPVTSREKQQQGCLQVGEDRTLWSRFRE